MQPCEVDTICICTRRQSHVTHCVRRLMPTVGDETDNSFWHDRCVSAEASVVKTMAREDNRGGDHKNRGSSIFTAGLDP